MGQSIFRPDVKNCRPTYLPCVQSSNTYGRFVHLGNVEQPENFDEIET